MESNMTTTINTGTDPLVLESQQIENCVLNEQESSDQSKNIARVI